MTRVVVKRLGCAVAVLWALVLTGGSLHAQLGIGTWTQTKGANTGGLLMTIEACCNGGYRLIYRTPGNGNILMTLESPMDGTDVPLLMAGKPTGETMGIKRVDAYHTFTVLKMNGKRFGTSKATLSADGKTLTVENEITDPIGPQTTGKTTEIWVLK